MGWLEERDNIVIYLHCDPFPKHRERRELHAICISRIDEVQLSLQPPRHRLKSREQKQRRSERESPIETLKLRLAYVEEER